MLRSSLPIIDALILLIRYLGATSNTLLLGRKAVQNPRRIFTFYLYRGRLRLCAVYVVSATLSSKAQDLTHSSFDGEEPVIRTKTICLRVTTCTVTHEVIGHPEWYNTHISTLQYGTRLWICVRIVQSKTRCKRSGSSHRVQGHPIIIHFGSVMGALRIGHRAATVMLA